MFVSATVTRRTNRPRHHFYRTIVSSLLLSILFGVAPVQADVVLSQQEINDAIRWGVEHNRTPEDIQEDIDGLNNARGGSGPVALPVELQSIDTPDGRVTATGMEASDYYLRTGRINFLRAVAETHKDALKALEEEAGKWIGWEQVPVTRAMSAYQELREAYGDLQADLLLIKAKIMLVNRHPTLQNYGWAYNDAANYEEAVSMWKNRRDKLDALNDERRQVESEYIDRIQKMTDKNPESAEGTSMMNRPKAMLDEIGRYQDMHREEIIRIRKEIEAEEEILRQLRERAKGSGGPPVSLPTGETAKGDEDGDSGGDESGEEGESIDDLLKEFGADEEKADDDAQRTELVNEEILGDIQARFDAAVTEFDHCSADFEARLNGLSGMEPEIICTDPGLAAAFGCAENQLYNCEAYYRDAHDRIAAADRSVNWRQMRMETELLTDGQSAVSPMDQITIILINTKYEQTTSAARQLRQMLQAAAPGCDPDDLREAPTWTSGEPEQRHDDGGSPTGGGGSAMGDGELRFEADGSPIRQEDTRAGCDGGSMDIEIVGDIAFPQTITRDGYYTVRVPLRWSVTGSRVKDCVVAVAVNIFGIMKEAPQVKTYSGNRSFDFQFSGSEVSFNLGANSIVVTLGGGIQCEGGSSDGASATIAMPYYRRGGE